LTRAEQYGEENERWDAMMIALWVMSALFWSFVLRYNLFVCLFSLCPVWNDAVVAQDPVEVSQLKKSNPKFLSLVGKRGSVAFSPIMKNDRTPGVLFRS
jgi:hypothetical protein